MIWIWLNWFLEKLMLSVLGLGIAIIFLMWVVLCTSPIWALFI